MAKRNARSRKQKPRRARSANKPAKKKTAKRTTARKTSRVARKTRPARRAKTRRAKPGTARPKPAALSRPRRVLPDEKIVIPSAPSTLGYTPKASSAESGHEKYHQHARQHASEDTRLTGGDVDADWNEAYSSGEESPGGDMPTPDQDVVEEIGRALGVEYDDAEELKGADKIVERDRHRWEYDPASAEDYRDRNKKED
jgi:hypothetical protein